MFFLMLGCGVISFDAKAQMSSQKEAAYFAVLKAVANYKINDEENKKEPYLYNGHDSWIYLFNDEVSNNDLSLFKWLASQSNSN